MDENVPQEIIDLLIEKAKITDLILRLGKGDGIWVGDGPSPIAIRTLYNALNSDEFVEILDSLWNACALCIRSAAFDEALAAWTAQHGLNVDWFLADAKRSLHSSHGRSKFHLAPSPMLASHTTMAQIANYSTSIELDGYEIWNPLRTSRVTVEAALMNRAWDIISMQLNGIEAKLAENNLDRVVFEQSTIEGDMPYFVRRHMLKSRPRDIALRKHFETVEGKQELADWKESNISYETGAKGIITRDDESEISTAARKIARLLGIDLTPLPRGPQPKRSK
jgi:hypothetical protein